ncbi:hypothetical protein PTE31013_02318 [Pandoraea terrigena]|uniref:Uncharacterized protein n=1 Tax=Pandoraea terrigena TaxID=2508292 RepID=A0A5E4V193_9BURK|nr:hypothetical protein PTE31013_02318 [Pandoraea terrigena]
MQAGTVGWVDAGATRYQFAVFGGAALIGFATTRGPFGFADRSVTPSSTRRFPLRRRHFMLLTWTPKYLADSFVSRCRCCGKSA